MELIIQKLDEQDKKIDAIYVSVEKTRKYILWTMIVTIIFFVVPLIGMVFLVPMLMSNLSSLYSPEGMSEIYKSIPQELLK